MGCFSLLQGHFWIEEIFFMIFFGTCFFKMKLNNFLIGSFSSEIGLVIEFHLQSAFTKILESF